MCKKTQQSTESKNSVEKPNTRIKSNVLDKCEFHTAFPAPAIIITAISILVSLKQSYEDAEELEIISVAAESDGNA